MCKKHKVAIFYRGFLQLVLYERQTMGENTDYQSVKKFLL